MISRNNTIEKIALIGCGYWGTILANNLYKIGYKNIIVYDSVAKNSLTLKKKFRNIIIEKNFINLIKNHKIKNIFFATPPSKNFKLVKYALKKNKNVFLEKPGVTKSKEIKILNNIAKKNKCILMFGYVYCYNDHIKKIKKIILKKKLGKILYLKFQRQNLGPIRNDVDASKDLATHDLSIFLNIFGKLPKIIKHIKYPILNKKISDISNLHTKMNDFFCDINTSWLSPTKVRRITVIGTKKMLLYNEMNINNPIKIFNKYAKYPKIHEFKKKFFKSKALIYLGKNYSIKIKSKSPLINEIKYFLKCSKNNNEPVTNSKFAFKILNFLERIK